MSQEPDQDSQVADSGSQRDENKNKKPKKKSKEKEDDKKYSKGSATSLGTQGTHTSATSTNTPSHTKTTIKHHGKSPGTAYSQGQIKRHGHGHGHHVHGVYMEEQIIVAQPQLVVTCTPIRVQIRKPPIVWIPMQDPIEGVPLGLEYLTLIDHVIVQQLIEIIEVLTGHETQNQYVLRNGNGERMYYAYEESTNFQRQCCGNTRAFRMHIVDNFKREVMLLRRPYKYFVGCCSACAFMPCCRDECTIEAPPGNVIGYVRQSPSCCSSHYVVLDEDKDKIFRIKGPCFCAGTANGTVPFPVFNMEKERTAMITKLWSGVQELFADADNFSVDFPMDLDAKHKAIIIGATFLIDFMEFEH